MLMEAVLEGGIQVVGWAILKIVTLGRYKMRGESDLDFQGIVGFAAIVLAGYLTYRLIA